MRLRQTPYMRGEVDRKKKKIGKGKGRKERKKGSKKHCRKLVANDWMRDWRSIIPKM